MDANINIEINENEKNKQIKDKYLFISSVGSGSFGTVYQAQLKTTGNIVAIKKVFQDRKYKNRELSILKQLNHINVIKLKDFFYTKTDQLKEDNNTINMSEDVYLNVVMDFIPDTMSRVIRSFYKNKKEIPKETLRLFSYQLLRSIAYIHSIGICHRDIKPQNILVDIKNNIVKLCDFGSAKKLSQYENNVSYICSRYYRAPELIFNSSSYSNAVDVWSIGCVIIELVIGVPVFQGECSVDQLVEIIKMLGTPSKKDIIAMNSEYNDYKFPVIKCFTWKQILGKYSNVDHNFLDLISKIMVYNPQNRYSAFEALAHSYFDSLRELKSLDSNLGNLLFYFSEEEIKSAGNLINILIPSWYNS